MNCIPRASVPSDHPRTSIYVSAIATLPNDTQLSEEQVKTAGEAADAIWQKAQAAVLREALDEGGEIDLAEDQP